MKISVKIFIYIIGILLSACLFLGCSVKNKNSVGDEESYTREELRDLLHSGPTMMPVDYSNMDENELLIRSIIEAIDIYEENKENGYDEEIYNEARYGIDNFSRMDERIDLDSIEDMVTVFNNNIFYNDFFNKYQLELPTSYFVPNLKDGYDEEVYLIFADGQYYLKIEVPGYDQENERMIVSASFNTAQDIDAYKVAKFYADIDGLELKVELVQNCDIYYYSSEKPFMLANAMGILSTKTLLTAYLWEQDGALGVIIMAGEHSVLNFDRCVLEKYEF